MAINMKNMIYRPFDSMERVERDQANDVADIKDALLKKTANECVALVPARSSLATVDRSSLEDIGVNFGERFISGLESMVSSLGGQISETISDGFGMVVSELEDIEGAIEDNTDAVWQVTLSVDDLKDAVNYGLGRISGQLTELGYDLTQIQIILATINETISKGFARLVKAVERNTIANEATAANTGALVKLQKRANQGVREANTVNIVSQLENMLTTKNYDGYTSVVENFIIRRRSISYKKLMGIIADRTANNYIRIYAILKIPEMGKGASLLIGVLSNQGEKERVRKLAKASLEEMGVKAVSGLSKCLKDPDLTIRRNAALFLFKLAKQSINIEKAGAALARTIANDEDDAVCLYATAAMFTALKNSQKVHGVYGLSSALFWGKNEEIKKLASAALNIIGPDKVFGTLSVNIKSNKDEQVRIYSAYCLFNYYVFASGKRKELAEKKLLEAGAAALPYIARFMDDKDPNIRKEALILLSKLNNVSLESLIDQIIVATGDDEKVVRDAAVVLLYQIGAPALAPLVKTLNSNPQLALNAAVTIVYISNQEDPVAIKYLINSLSYTNLERRKCALSAIALAAHKGFKVDAAALSLIPLLGDDDKYVRIEAEKALLGIKPALFRKGTVIYQPSRRNGVVVGYDSPALVVFRNLLSSPNVTARRRAAITLGKINDGYTLSCELVIATGDQDKEVRELAVAALVKIGDKVVPVVQNFLNSSDQTFRDNAQLVLAKIEEKDVLLDDKTIKPPTKNVASRGVNAQQRLRKAG